MADDDPVPALDTDERARLDAWTAPPPPLGFADRVLAARRTAPPASPPAPSPLARPIRTAAIVVSAACAGAFALAAIRGLGAEPTPAVRGESAGGPRRSIALGARGVAVAEAGAALAWTVEGAAHIEQTAGSVFYRVEPGGPFTVVTPAGAVRATGTCFSVEIEPMSHTKSTLAGAAAGAVVAAIAVITVYEGGVVAAGADGERRVVAGEHVRLGERPDVGPMVAPIAVVPLARDQAQRARIAALEAQVAQLTAGHADLSWIDPTPEELTAMVGECRVLMDAPDVFESEPAELELERGARVGLSAAEVAAVNDAIRDVHGDYRERLRALYVEVTGDSAGAEALSPRALFEEIDDKSPRDAGPQARRRIARERAGLDAPPADLSRLPPLERALRAQVDLGAVTERALAARLGAERAHALRRPGSEIFGSRGSFRGCPKD